MPSLRDLTLIGDAIPGDLLDPNPQTLGGATDLVFTRKFKSPGPNYADYLFQIKSTSAAPAVRIVDIKITDAYLTSQKMVRVDNVNTELWCVFAQVPSTWTTDYTFQNIPFPGVGRSSFVMPAEFAFRTSPTTLPTQVRTEHAFFLGPPTAIATYPLFFPVDVQGFKTSTISDDTNPSVDEYVAMVQGQQEIVVESIKIPWKGDIYERRTKFALAQ